MACSCTYFFTGFSFFCGFFSDEVMSGAELFSNHESDVEERESSSVVLQTSSCSGLESEDEDWSFDQQECIKTLFRKRKGRLVTADS